MSNKKQEKIDHRKNRKPVFGRAYEAYLTWISLPSILKGQNDVQFYIERGFKDEGIIQLLQIKTQGEFAKAYGIKNKNTLSEWNQRAEAKDRLTQVRKWAAKLTPNVLMALYSKILKEGDAPRVKLWAQLIEEWNESVKVEHGADDDTMDKILKLFTKVCGNGNAKTNR
jgi:hypothetical protein